MSSSIIHIEVSAETELFGKKEHDEFSNSDISDFRSTFNSKWQLKPLTHQKKSKEQVEVPKSEESTEQAPVQQPQRKQILRNSTGSKVFAMLSAVKLSNKQPPKDLKPQPEATTAPKRKLKM